VSVERVVGATEFAPLAGHDVHRIMEERFRESGGSWSHENFGSEVGSSHKGEGADVVVMGVRDEDGFEILGNLVEERSGVPTVLAGVHSGVQKNRVFTCA